jgi:translocation and assembly module TamB
MTSDASPDAPAARPRRRIARVVGVLVLLFLAVIGGFVWYGLSESGLPFVVARVVAQTGGRLEIEGASGAVGSAMRFRRLVWHGNDTTVEADDVVVEWRPGALWHRELAVSGLGAARVSIAVKPSSGGTTPPTNLALPLTVALDRVAVGELVVRAGPRTTHITGLQFGYRGDHLRHTIDGLRLVSDYGALSGAVTLGATAPLPIEGQLAIRGDGPLQGATLDTAIGGTLGDVSIVARGELRGAALDAQASLTPFATSPLARASATLQHVDAAAFDPALPHTALSLVADAQPVADGFAGSAEVRNETPGPIDAGRLPFQSASARYHWQPTVLELDSLDVLLPGNGRARGRGRLPLGEPRSASQWSVQVADVDPALLHTRLLHARIRGDVSATVEGARQTIAGTLADGRNEVAFRATVADRRVDIASARMRAGSGTLEGNGTVALEGGYPFQAHVVATRFDPSTFVSGLAASLDGTIDVRGAAQPALQMSVDASLRGGSRYRGVAVSGTAHAQIARNHATDVKVDAQAGDTHVVLGGAAGAVGDRLAFSVDTARLQSVEPLLPAALHPAVGSLHATGTLRVEPGGVGGDVHARAAALRLGSLLSAATLELDGAVAPGGNAAGAVPLGQRTFEATLDASRMTVEGRLLDRARGEVRGTLARHTLRLDGSSEGLTVSAAGSGALTQAADMTASSWQGRVDTLDTRGSLALHLRAPATVELARNRVRISEAHLEIADGRADVDELRIVDGHVDTRGSFTGVPLDSVLALAGQKSPLASTLVLGGEWAIVASPRLHGTFAIRRERGDLYASDTSQSAGLAFGITALQAAGTLRDDALEATATLRSARAGNADGQVHVGSIAGAAQGTLPANAPLSGTLDAELASLAPLQPFVGTQAVIGGRLRARLRAAGTLGAPLLSGNVEADALRVDAPQYGVHVTDGRLVARLADGIVTLDELSFVGGEGRFTARGTLAEPGRATSARVQWTAERFRVTDRPDLRLVLEGNGTLAIVDKRVALAGEVKVDGHVEYEASPPGRLGPDVVVKGRPVLERREAGMRNLPLTLDLDVDLGRVTFSGEGLDATLGGRVKVTTGPTGALRGRGTIRAIFGTYYAFGQKLTIDRGRLIFDGPLDDPALDVVALRKNLPVEAGVELSGTVKIPRVRITSNPPVAENEALAWLITGQGLSGTGRSDYAALGAASAALLGRNGKPITTRIAQQFGLDDISLQSSGTATGTSSNPVAGQVVVLGKRISDRLTLGYEQGLSLASGALRLEYALNRTLTLRAEAGTVSSLGLYYRRSFE